MLTNARVTDPAESATAYAAGRSKIVVEAVIWIYTLGSASDERVVELYEEFRKFRTWWPDVDPETVRKRCSDARRLDRRIQKVGATKSSHGKTVGVYGYAGVAA